MPRRLALVAAPLLIAVLTLGGCTPEPRIPAAEPQPTVSPLFATDEEALAAATAAYEEYLAVVDQVLADSGADAQRLSDLVSPQVFETEQEGFDEFSANGWTAIGSSTLVKTTLQSHTPGNAGEVLVSIYACVDIEQVDVVDSSGSSVVAVDRPAQLAYEAHFSAQEAGRLTLQEESLWSGGGICDG